MHFSTASLSGIIQTLRIRPLTPDHLSDVRYIHSTAFRSQGYPHYTPEELDAFERLVRTPGYCDALLSDALLGGFLESELVATAAWRRADQNPQVGRVTALFVRPLFERIGVGTRMLFALETAATAAGCTLASVRAPLSGEAFLAVNGYELAGRGTRPLIDGMALNVAFMKKRLGSAQRRAAPAMAN